MDKKFLCYGSFDERVYNCNQKGKCPDRERCINLTELNKAVREKVNKNGEKK